MRICLFSLLTALSSCVFTKIDKTPLSQTAHYQQFIKVSDNLKIKNISGDTIKAAWAKINITPTKRVRLAGYGSRFGRKSSGIHDSLYSRAIVFDNKITKTAIITSDLLLMPPEVIKKLTIQLPKIGWQIHQIYFSATHTHNSLGGWARKTSGKLIAGKYRKKTVATLTQSFLKVLTQADKSLQPVKVGFTKQEIPELLGNRLSDTAKIDASLRTVWLRQPDGKTVAIVSYQAHPTCLEDKQMQISGDYPAALVSLLEKQSNISLAAFCAGGVGSHSPKSVGSNFDKITNMATHLAQKLLPDTSKIVWQYENKLQCLQMPLPLRKPQWRISKNLNKALRPWVFYALFGKYEAQVSFLQIGNIVFAGTPCDFSGMLTPNIESYFPDKHLIINSFNGGYIGYITPDAYYNLPTYESKDMNWFGQENGKYLSEVIIKTIQKLK
ncbi:MAG: neutral/alkaline non-lysosomal ceramidase N-terminal domain-containing protein [Verrucomicrobia bacterium]|nr:neutral/alkaline non-lysosomal ceramidase N-terminal domain-containing protein [Cytophagales bacterium]